MALHVTSTLLSAYGMNKEERLVLDKHFSVIVFHYPFERCRSVRQKVLLVLLMNFWIALLNVF